MTSPLASVPAAQRRRAAWTLAGFAGLLAAVGAVATSGRSSAATVTFAVIGFTAAVLVALLAWGLAHSVRLDESDAALDAALDAVITDAIAAAGMTCSCGHDHDPDELHVVDAHRAAPPRAAPPRADTGRADTGRVDPPRAAPPRADTGAIARECAQDVTGGCAHDGAGDTCGHDCDTCVLTALRSPAG